MLQLHLLDIAKKQFPDLNFDHQADLIRVEKILKAEAKLNPSIQLNDVENLITFLKHHRAKFLPILAHKNIAIILKGKGESINQAPFNRNEISDEILEEFQQAFAENIEHYLNHCIRSNSWYSIRSVFFNYSFLVSDKIRTAIFQTLNLKNQALISAIKNNQFIAFCHSNSFATEVDYFYMLSSIGQFYFDEDIFALNNIIVSKQKNTKLNLSYLGKILYAVTYFEAYTENLKETLASNQDVAMSWTHPNSHTTTKDWTTAGVISIIVLIILCLVALVAFPGAPGAAIGITIFLIRIINFLRKK